MTSIVELSSQDMSAHEIEGPQVGVDLDEVGVFKQQAAKTAMANYGGRNVEVDAQKFEVFPHGGL